MDATTVSFAPSGQQFEIACGEQRAIIVEVGGCIRSYTHGQRDVLEPFPAGAICDAAHGAPLIPWPNRVAGGSYSFEGSQHQLALSEPERGGAIHGLLRWRPWSASEHTAERVVMRARLHPSPGYPFALELSIAYELGEDGLSVATSARNIGPTRCPYGAGQHPYLSPGAPGALQRCELSLPARTRLLLDEDSQTPVGREPVAGTRFDYRVARAIGADRLDDAFTDLQRGANGRALATLSCPDGRIVELWADERYGFLQVFTGDPLTGARHRSALAVEPMTCAPNAFQSGDGLLVLEPGESLTSTWGVRLAPGPQSSA